MSHRAQSPTFFVASEAEGFSVHHSLSHIAGWMVVASRTRPWLRSGASIGSAGLLHDVQVNFRDMMGSPKTSTTNMGNTKVVRWMLGSVNLFYKPPPCGLGQERLVQTGLGEILIQSGRPSRASSKPPWFQATVRPVATAKMPRDYAAFDSRGMVIQNRIEPCLCASY